MTLTKPRHKRPTANHRKLRGAHHKKDQHYIRAYWPYLPVFAVLGLGILLNTVISRANHDVLGYSTSIGTSSLLAETNAARSIHHVAALELNQQLSHAAQAKANDMASRDYWSHITPDGKQPWTFIAGSGYQFEAAGENLAYGFGSSDQVISAWMHSPEHEENVLNGAYRDVGFATANVTDFLGHGPTTIVVALYGEPNNLNSTDTTATLMSADSPHTYSRAQVVTSATWIQLGLAAMCGAALMLFFVRHTIAWHRVLVRGEEFFLKHPFMDLFLLGAVVFAFVLSHVAGSTV
jgi:hypothetical protein